MCCDLFTSRYQPKGRTRHTDVSNAGAVHHHLKSLRGCSAQTLGQVQAAFEGLYAGLLAQLSTFTPSNLLLNRAIMRCWALHFTETDHAFLHRVVRGLAWCSALPTVVGCPIRTTL